MVGSWERVASSGLLTAACSRARPPNRIPAIVAAQFISESFTPEALPYDVKRHALSRLYERHGAPFPSPSKPDIGCVGTTAFLIVDMLPETLVAVGTMDPGSRGMDLWNRGNISCGKPAHGR